MTIVDRRYSVAEGTAVKAPCRVATTANITLSGEQTIDGVAVVSGDRVLVKNQTTGSQNGIYDASTGNWTRSRDFDGAYDVVTGTRVYITSGSANNDIDFVVSTTGPITIDTTSIAFTPIEQLSAADAAASATAAAASQTAAAASATAAAASAALLTPFPQLFAMANGTIVESHASNAVTFTIKTLAGATPSSSDKVRFLFRNATATAGDYTIVDVTSALSITISSGSTLGTTTLGSRLWLLAIYTGSAVELAVINCLSGSNIYPLSGWGIISTTAEGGAGAADSAQGAYSTTARTSKPYIVLGYAAYENGFGTPGVWNISPDRIQLYGPGVPLPGQMVQVRRTDTGDVATGTTIIPNDDTIPQNTEGDQYMSLTITASSACNLCRVRCRAHVSNSTSDRVVGALFRDNVVAAVAAIMDQPADPAYPTSLWLDYSVLFATALSTTFKLRAGSIAAATLTFNGQSGARRMGGVMNSFIEIREIMT